MTGSWAPAPPGAWKPLRNVVKRAAGSIDRFLEIQAASGIILMVAALLAFVLANSAWGASYAALWHTPIGVRVGSLVFERSLEWVVNDVLMVVFFFVVGLEIRREIHCGELSELRRAALPVVAASGGVVVPALLYIAVAGAPQTRNGWAVPTATDIAFAVGVLTLLGRRAPPALRVLLLALAVIDDLAAIIVIAAFYSSGIVWGGLAVAAAGLSIVYIMNAAGVRQRVLYVLPGLVVWGGTYAAGIHPTIAGVALGLMTPVEPWLGTRGFLEAAPKYLNDAARVVGLRTHDAHAFSSALRPLAQARQEAVSPAESLIELLHPWVAFAIMPIFALANAGVAVDTRSLSGNAGVVAGAAALGLVIGKPLGIMLFSGLALRIGLVQLPRGLSYRHLLVLGVVAGVGFTMALFVAQLAFADGSLLAAAKVGVLGGSLIAGVVGLIVGRLTLHASDEHSEGAASGAEAECSTES
jgi:NhaA family Na+:H+ antiporter